MKTDFLWSPVACGL